MSWELSELSVVKSGIGGAPTSSTKVPPSTGLWHMDALPAAKTDLRPWRCQIDALLTGIAMSPVVRRAMLDAFEEHGLLAYTTPEPEIAVDELGRLHKACVNKALEDLEEKLRSRVVAVLDELHALA
jgi:hypothetical protein